MDIRPGHRPLPSSWQGTPTKVKFAACLVPGDRVFADLPNGGGFGYVRSVDPPYVHTEYGKALIMARTCHVLAKKNGQP
jgi:hypothetical protein